MSYTLRSSLLLFQPPAPQVFTYISFGGETTAAGAAVVSKTKVFTTSGGASLAGAAAVSKTKVFTASGGATIGGAATVSKTKVFTATGGLSVAGAGLTQGPVVVPPVAAPLQVAGPRILLPEPPRARPAVVFRYVGSGGVQVGGRAQIWRTLAWSFVATGELRLGGAAFLELIHVFGGAVAAGTPRRWAGQAHVETAFPVRAWQARARRDEDELLELGIL